MRNFQKELEKIIEENQRDGKLPSLLLHSCCAPCSSYTLEYLSKFFNITVFYYNPNIYPANEYRHRVDEQKRLIAELPQENKINFIEGRFDTKEFYSAVKGLEHIKEGGERCFACYRLRLEETAKIAKENGFDFFTTTLSISPLKISAKINEIGEELSAIYNVAHLPSDFKKKNGYKRSIELSKEYDLYRQDYCGCVFSLEERRKQQAEQQ